ncbi:putative metal-dependent hydrolase YcfH [Glandiceps talaboti]
MNEEETDNPDPTTYFPVLPVGDDSLLEVQDLVEAWDSHFHLTGQVDACLEKPTNYPINLERSDGWKIAVGVPPKVIHQLTEDKFKYLEELIQLPQVVALGEIGLDRTEPSDVWREQEDTLIHLLKLGSNGKPIILHVRGPHADKYSSDVNDQVLNIVHECCEPDLLIHLHCYTGDRRHVQRRIKGFPNYHFGFTGVVVKFDKEQSGALREVPLDRLLLETDSPYFPLTSDVRINTLLYIGDVAVAVANMRNISIWELLNITSINTKALYHC